MVRAVLLPGLALLLAALPVRANNLPNPPPGKAHDSAKHPITIYADDEEMAATAMAVAEALWVEQVDGMGFEPPMRLHDGHVQAGFDLYIGEPGIPDTLATFDIQGDIPATPRADCPTLGILVRSTLGIVPGLLEMGTRHLFNHSSLHAVDCLEPQIPAYDFITCALDEMAGKDPMFKGYYLKSFQKHPQWPIDFMSYADPYYSFGSALFAIYLEEAHGAYDGRLLASLWRRTPQDGHVTGWDGEHATADVKNGPDYLQATGAELAARGTSLPDAFAGFAEWRYFVGKDDDGGHFRRASTWTGDEVAREASLAAADLPAEAQAATPVGAFASSYVEVATGDALAGSDLEVAFAGNPESAWVVRVLRVPPAGSGPAPASLPVPLDAAATGKVVVGTPSAWARVVLVAVNLGPGTWDPAQLPWTTKKGDYRYAVRALAGAEPAPEAAPDTVPADAFEGPDDGPAEVPPEVEAEAAVSEEPAAPDDVAPPGDDPSPPSRPSSGGGCTSTRGGADVPDDAPLALLLVLALLELLWPWRRVL